VNRATSDLKGAAEELARRLEDSVANSVKGEGKAAVAFSGGLDSAILVACARQHTEVIAVSGFVEGSLDSRRAEECAGEMKVKWAPARISKDRAIKQAMGMSLPFEPTPMDRSLWVLYSAVAEKAAELGAGTILLGQLADELFGGYAKYSEAAARSEDEATQMMARDVSEYPARGRLRDVAACERWLTPRFPYEAVEVVEFAMGLPMAYKIERHQRKVILRRAALKLGVPVTIAQAPKKAAQYSSGVQRALG